MTSISLEFDSPALYLKLEQSLSSGSFGQIIGVGVHVLVAAAGEIEDDEVVSGHTRRALDKAGDGVGRFESRNNALDTRKEFCRFERGGIGNRGIFGAALVG